MLNVRDIMAGRIEHNELEVIRGLNGKYVQNQGKDDDGEICYGLYDVNGDWESETTDLDIALDYIGLEDKHG